MKERKRPKSTGNPSTTSRNSSAGPTHFFLNSSSGESEITKLELNNNGNLSLRVTVEDLENREEFDNHIYIHSTAEVSPQARIGLGSRVWQQAQVRERAVVGQQCTVGKGVYIDRDVMVGDRVKIQSYVSIPQGVMIESGVFIGANASFLNDRYPRAITRNGELKHLTEHEVECTLVRYGASIGAGVIVLPGVRIGSFAMIEAGAVVGQDVADHQLIRGNPGQPVGYVCRCGEPLSQAGQPEGWFCPACQEVYLFTN